MSLAVIVLLVVGGAALVIAAVVYAWPARTPATERVEFRPRAVVSLPPGPPRVLLAVDEKQLAQLYFGSLPDVPELLLTIDESTRSAGSAKGDAAGVSAGLEQEDTRASHRELATKEEDPGRRSRAFEHFTGARLPALDLRPDDSYEEYRRRVRSTLAAAGRDVDTLVDDAMQRAWRSERDTRDSTGRPALRSLSGMVRISARWTVVSSPDAEHPGRDLVLRTTAADEDGAWDVTAVARGDDVPDRWHGQVGPGRRVIAAAVGVVIDAAAATERHISIVYCHFD